MALGALAIITLVPCTASASGFEIGGRVGYGIPLGEVGEDVDLNDGVSGQIPLQLDLGFRVDDALMLGGYLGYGIAFPSDESCEDTPLVEVSCSASDVRLGVQGAYHFKGIYQDSFWLGAGLGYEWLSLNTKANSDEASVTVHGMEFFHLQAGYDFAVGEGFRIGPYALFSFAQYSRAKVTNEVTDLSASADVEEKALHEWLLFGVKGTFDILL